MLPRRDELLIETFPRGNRASTWSPILRGPLAHQTLGMLLTRRLDRAGASRSASSPPIMRWRSGAWRIWAAHFADRRPSIQNLFDEDMLWRRSRSLAQRDLAAQAHLPLLRVIAGLIEASPSPARRRPVVSHACLPTSSMTCCAATSPITSCSKPRVTTRARDLLDIQRLAICSSESKGISG